MKSEFNDRLKKYEDCYDYSITNRLPIVVRVDGRGFTKLTRNIPKPFCYKFSAAMAYAMFETIKQIDSAIIGYTQSDEISFVLWSKNKGAEPWFNNKIQKVCSVLSSMVTYYFGEFLLSADEPPNIKGPAFFDAKMFALPNATEAINNLIFRQQDCRVNAVSSAVVSELSKRHSRSDVYKKIHGISTVQRINILKNECGIDFESNYPYHYKWGIATYKAPKIIKKYSGNITRPKWTLDVSPPDFTNDRLFLVQLLSTGSDIFRAERVFKDES